MLLMCVCVCVLISDYVYFETSSTAPYQIRRIEELCKARTEYFGCENTSCDSILCVNFCRLTSLMVTFCHRVTSYRRIRT